MVFPGKQLLFFFAVIFVAAISISGMLYIDRSARISKIHGFNLVAPRNQFPIDSLKSVKETGAEWIAVVPYAFCDTQTGNIHFGNGKQWWGETPEGIETTIQMAHEIGLKVMIKPHLWVRGQGWAGDLTFNSDDEWKHWEDQYNEYLQTFTNIAEKYNVEMLCIGTEIRQSTKNRTAYWMKLIEETRNNYNGKITYAANWDEYTSITFWNKLDYIGVDAYFPIHTAKIPSVQELKLGWSEAQEELLKVSAQYNKEILFTEYGYESIDYTAIGHWNVDKDTLEINFESQSNAYQALYESFNNKEWWAGGFAWKWHLDYRGDQIGTIKAYTPQHKPAMKTIESYFNSSQ